jgi:hypothetical protein
VLRGGRPGVSETEPKDDEGPKDAALGSGKIQDEGKQTKKPEVEALNQGSPCHPLAVDARKYRRRMDFQ